MVAHQVSSLPFAPVLQLPSHQLLVHRCAVAALGYRVALKDTIDRTVPDGGSASMTVTCDELSDSAVAAAMASREDTNLGIVTTTAGGALVQVVLYGSRPEDLFESPPLPDGVVELTTADVDAHLEVLKKREEAQEAGSTGPFTASAVSDGTISSTRPTVLSHSSFVLSCRRRVWFRDADGLGATTGSSRQAWSDKSCCVRHDRPRRAALDP